MDDKHWDKEKYLIAPKDAVSPFNYDMIKVIFLAFLHEHSAHRNTVPMSLAED